MKDTNPEQQLPLQSKPRKRRSFLLLSLFLILCAFLGGLLFTSWEEFFPGEQNRTTLQQHVTKETIGTPKVTVKLYFLDPEQHILGAETREIEKSNEVTEHIQRLLNEYLKGPFTGLQPLISKGTQLMHIFLDERNVLYLDFSPTFKPAKDLSIHEEVMYINALSQTIFENSEDVTAIKLMVDGSEILSISGHIDLEKPVVRSI